MRSVSLTGLIVPSAGITNAVARLLLFKVSNDVVRNEVDIQSTSAATTGNLFRYDSSADQYIFNLSTAGLTVGKYQLRVDLHFQFSFLFQTDFATANFIYHEQTQNFVATPTCPSGGTDTRVKFTQNEHDSLVNDLTLGTLSRAGVLQQIVEHPPFVNAKSKKMFVLMEYFGYLRRNPDEDGYQFWLQKLNQFDGISSARRWSRRLLMLESIAPASDQEIRK